MLTFLTRGVYLILLDVSLVAFGWTAKFFPLNFDILLVYGLSMFSLAILVYFPRKWLAVITVAIIFGHHVFDADGLFGVPMEMTHPLWIIIHEGGVLVWGDVTFGYSTFSLIPFLGVFLLGYVVAPVFKWNQRNRVFIGTAVISLILFIFLRGFNLYGDPFPWVATKKGYFHDLLAILNTNRYPFSTAYTLYAFIWIGFLLAFFDSMKNKITDIFQVFGKTSLFCYVIHIYIIRVMIAIVGVLLGHSFFEILLGSYTFSKKLGFPLWTVFVLWLAVVWILYFLAKWLFDKKKLIKRPWWIKFM